ncbi:AraC family transcriptional regulator [Megamonas hypermegale]|uniref:helix-turn-helix domain-containing protein n=1 Tax=Megamonas hypermegale TaxID=158847 RepID=UPI0025A470CF|nr:AraC family transcriptional regulator [Megamonas hypermegale]MDM8143565.1 AraC family transcriptional regulator [Megamonas hypermegale]
MLKTTTNQQLNLVFKNGILPTMVYINRQECGRNKIERPLHKHDTVCEIVLVYKGSGTYMINNKKYTLREGDIAFYNQGDLHEVSSASDTEIGDYCIGLTNLNLKNLPYNHLIAANEAYVRQSGNMFATLKELCEQMYTLGKLNEHSNLTSQLLCTSFIIIATSLSSFTDYENNIEKDKQFMNRILNYLDEHFTEDISINKVADHLGCSNSYISHLFKKSLGITPMQYVIKRRIGLAQTLLISTDLSATQIATMVGYDNANYFINSFTKIIGITPIRYRNFYLKELRGNRHQS